MNYVRLYHADLPEQYGRIETRMEKDVFGYFIPVTYAFYGVWKNGTMTTCSEAFFGCNAHKQARRFLRSKGFMPYEW